MVESNPELIGSHAQPEIGKIQNLIPIEAQIAARTGADQAFSALLRRAESR